MCEKCWVPQAVLLLTFETAAVVTMDRAEAEGCQALCFTPVS